MSTFYQRRNAYHERKAQPEVKVAIGFFIVCFAIIAIALFMDNSQTKEWESKVKAVNAAAAIEVPKVFASWGEQVVLDDGTIERWSGAKSELLFIEPHTCNSYDTDRLAPCWRVWAKTNNTMRYFTVNVEVNIKDFWKLGIWEKHRDESVQNVVKKALSLQRADVAKKLAVAQVNA